MKPRFVPKALAIPVFSILVILGFYAGVSDKLSKYKFPYKQAGLTERQAATHLLNRFTFGPRPGDVDAVLKMGLEKWFDAQLAASQNDDSLKLLLEPYEALRMNTLQILNTYPENGYIAKLAVKEGVIDKDSLASAGKPAYRETLKTYMEQKGYKPQQELFQQLINQKIIRSAYTNNQLQEVLTDFWFNHFNVSLTKNQCAEHILSYERDVIRPNALGSFEGLLMATAKSPAMLYYLDNFTSSGGSQERPVLDQSMQMMEERMMQSGDSVKAKRVEQLIKTRKNQGLNENYAREVMELHTLGVDGGYTQNDVTQAAKVLTGWTVFPLGEKAAGNQMQKLIDRFGEENLEKKGYVHEGDFVFIPTRHDHGEKVVLGHKFTDEGYKEGVDLLYILAKHPSTAKFISRKLAVRFVADNPPQSLIDKMAKTFLEKDGSIKDVLITMVNSPEFWSKEALREKTKSPFELAISTVRSLDAEVNNPYQLFNWVNRMGQKVYYYQAPTGFPDRGQYWINTGSLLNRMNFGLAIASNRIPGIKVNLLSLNQNHEPESAESALLKYGKIIMPERDLQATIKRLTPLLNDPNLGVKVENAASKTELSAPSAPRETMQADGMMSEAPVEKLKGINKPQKAQAISTSGSNTMLAQVVGVIIGSPEFQRR